MTKNTKTILQTLIFLTLGGLLFYWALSGKDLSEVWTEIKQADFKWILLAMLCGVLSHLARAARWNLLLKPLGHKASLAASFHAVILGYLVNLALPRVGEITRPAVLHKLENIPFNKLVGTVVVERVVDLLITILIAISIFFIQFDIIADFFLTTFSGVSSASLLWYALAGVLALALLFVVYLKREWFYNLPVIGKFKTFFEGILDGFKTIFNLEQKGLFIFYSLFIWAMYFCMPYFTLFAIEGTSHLGASAALTILLFGTAAMIVPFPGGIGTYEFMVPAALVLYGISSDSLVSTSYTLITHALQFIVVIGVGIISIVYFILKSQTLKKNELESNH